MGDNVQIVQEMTADQPAHSMWLPAFGSSSHLGPWGLPGCLSREPIRLCSAWMIVGILIGSAGLWAAYTTRSTEPLGRQVEGQPSPEARDGH
jgi:hypothetical protein